MKEKLGADKVEVESTDNGGVEVKADGEEVAESTEAASESTEETESTEDDNDDDFEKEIEEGLKKAERFKL